MNIKKVVFLSVLALALSATAASAAVNIQEAGFTVNGNQTDTVRAGSNVRLGATLDVSAPDEVEYGEYKIMDENGILVQTTSCFAITPRLVNKNDVVVYHSVKLVNDLPDQPLDLELRTFGVGGLAQSDGCDEDNFNGSAPFNGRLFVERDSRSSDANDVVNNGSSSSDEEVDAPPAWFFNFSKAMESYQTAIMSILDKIADKLSKTETPACPPAYTGMNVNEVQGWLMNNGYAAGFNAIGVYSPTGFWGTVSSSAYATAMDACK